MKNTKLLLISFLSLFLVPCICALPAISYTISGTVYYSVGGIAVPAENVLVEFRDINNVMIEDQTTLADGIYSFTTDLPGIPPKIIVASIPLHPEVAAISKPTGPVAVNDVIDFTFPFACPDSDVDTYYAAWCGGTDCDDNDALINPNALDNTDDNVDNDCDGTTDEDYVAAPPSDGNGGGGGGGGGSDNHPTLITPTPVVQETRTLEQPEVIDQSNEDTGITGAATAETGAGNYVIAGLIVLVLLVIGFFAWKKYK